MEPIADAVVIQRVLSGEVEAYALLVSRYRERYGRYARQMLGSREDAEDVLQEAFVRAFRSLGRCREPNRFDAWLFRIVVNRCRTAAMRRRRRENLVVADETATALASQPHPAEQLAWSEEIERALAGLDAGQREAFLLKHVEDRSYDEMAELTGLGVSALKMRVSRACEALRRALGEVRRA